MSYSHNFEPFERNCIARMSYSHEFEILRAIEWHKICLIHMFLRHIKISYKQHCRILCITHAKYGPYIMVNLYVQYNMNHILWISIPKTSIVYTESPIFVKKSGQKICFTFLCRISKSRLSVFILEGGIEPLNPNELNGEIIMMLII